MSTSSYRIAGQDFYHSELIYDDEGITIYRSWATLLSLFLFSIAMGLLNMNHLIQGFKTQDYSWPFFMVASITLALGTFAVFGIILLVRFWKKNQRAYTFEEIVKHEIQSNSKYVKLIFFF